MIHAHVLSQTWRSVLEVCAKLWHSTGRLAFSQVADLAGPRMSIEIGRATALLTAGFSAFACLACGGGETTMKPATGLGGFMAPAPTAGVSAPVGGVAGTLGGAVGLATAGTSSIAGSPAPGGSVTAGTGAPRAGAPAPVGSGTAGSSAAGMPAPAPAAGSGGAPGGMAGAPSMPRPDGALIRGPDPTMATAMKNGTYQTKSYTDGFADGAQFLAGTIYYPTDADPPFAGVVICPGFVSYQDSVAPWGPFLASHGIVTMTIDTNTPGDTVDIRQGALMDALASLKGEHTRSGSPLMGKLDMTRFGLMGWSMGGGGTWLNAATRPELKTGISLAGHILTLPGGQAMLRSATVPILMLAGSADTAILGLGMSQPIYDTIPASTPKMLYEVSGASHFDISPSTGGGLFGLFGLSWQKVFLEGDMRYKQFLMLPKPSNASDYRTNIN